MSGPGVGILQAICQHCPPYSVLSCWSTFLGGGVRAEWKKEGACDPWSVPGMSSKPSLYKLHILLTSLSMLHSHAWHRILCWSPCRLWLCLCLCYSLLCKLKGLGPYSSFHPCHTCTLVSIEWHLLGLSSACIHLIRWWIQAISLLSEMFGFAIF